MSPQKIQHVCTPRIATVEEADVLARGLGACPGVAAGSVATTAAEAVRVDVAGAAVRAGERTVPEGTLVTIDGTGGVVVVGSPPIATTAAGPYLHRLLGWADEVSGGASDRPEAERLSAARAVLLHHGAGGPAVPG